ncbi:hypothetical protein GCM10022254_50220 [Actinomadura meridiana]|uniref:DNA primase/polymerase bifunctional N-terminal domain-containing protein n=1 Tax=Actinomadura meridiana TaxID=559626 RepID=A0ABP8CCY9_9ACTN
MLTISQSGDLLTLADNGGQTDEPLKLTLIPFQNVEETVLDPDPVLASYGVRRGTGKWSKKPSVYGAFTEYSYGIETTIDTPGVKVIPYPIDEPVEALQVGVVCSLESGLVVIDVDDPEAYAESDLGDDLPLELAYTRRGQGGHIYLDYRHVPREKWPVQGPIQGGDIKSAGFVAAAGSLHYSGDRYGRADGDILVVTEEEVESVLKAKRQATGSSRPGAYRGDGHSDDDHLARSTYGWVFSGLDEAEVRELWQELADEIEDPSWPFTERDFQRHYRGAVRKYESSQVTEVSGSNLFTAAEPGDLRERLPETLLTRLDALTKPMGVPRCEVLDDPEAIAKKIKAENDPDRWSRDWKERVPEGAQAVFTRIASLRADGIKTSPHAEWLKAQDPTGEIREYLSNAEWVMAEVDGVYEVLRDRLLPEAEAEICVCGTKVVKRNFAGAAPDRCVHVGPRWSKAERLDAVFTAQMHLTSLARQASFGGPDEPEHRPQPLRRRLLRQPAPAGRSQAHVGQPVRGLASGAGGRGAHRQDPQGPLLPQGPRLADRPRPVRRRGRVPAPGQARPEHRRGRPGARPHTGGDPPRRAFRVRPGLVEAGGMKLALLTRYTGPMARRYVRMAPKYFGVRPGTYSAASCGWCGCWHVHEVGTPRYCSAKLAGVREAA